MDTWRTAGRWWVRFFCDNSQHRSALQLWIMGNIGPTLVHREEICRDRWGIYPSVTTPFFQSEQIYSVTARYASYMFQRSEKRKFRAENSFVEAQSLETRQICRVVSEVQQNFKQLRCDEYMAQRQSVHEGAPDICTLKIHSVWFPLPLLTN